MPQQLPWFSVTVAFRGMASDDVPAAIADLRDEFTARPHLRVPRVYEDTDGGGVVVEFLDQGPDLRALRLGVLDEMGDIVVALFKISQGVTVDLVDVRAHAAH